MMVPESPYIKKESNSNHVMDKEDQTSQSEIEALQLDSEYKNEDSFHIKDEKSILPQSNYTGETILKGEGECEVCMDVHYLLYMECCQIKVCKNCLKEYIRQKVNLGLIDITCIGSFCDIPLDTNFMMNVTDSYISTRLSYLLEHRKRSKKQVACPWCENILTVNDVDIDKLSGKQRIRIECTNCNESVCGRCMLPWHETTRCPSAGIEKWAKKKAGRAKNAIKCPQCGVSIATILSI